MFKCVSFFTEPFYIMWLKTEISFKQLFKFLRLEECRCFLVSDFFLRNRHSVESWQIHLRWLKTASKVSGEACNPVFFSLLPMSVSQPGVCLLIQFQNPFIIAILCIIKTLFVILMGAGGSQIDLLEDSGWRQSWLRRATGIRLRLLC
jgi:hypothetical protein